MNLLLLVLLGRLFELETLGHVSFGLSLAYIVSQIVGALVLSPVASLASRYSEGTLFREASRAWLTIHAVAIPILLAAGALILALASGAGGLWSGGAAYGLAIASIVIVEATRRYVVLISRPAMLWVIDLVRFPLLFGLLWGEIGATASDLPATLLSFIAASFLAGVVPVWIAILSRRDFWSKGVNGRYLTSARYLRFGRPLLLTEILRFFNMDFPAFVLRILVGPEAFGLFRIAQSIAFVLKPVMVALESIVPKWLGAAHRTMGAEGAARKFRRVVGIVAALATSVYASVYFLSPAFLRYTFPDAPADAVLPTIGVLCVFSVFLAINRMLSFGLRAQARMTLILVATAISAGVSLVLAYPMVTWLEQLGVSLVILASATVEMAIYFVAGWVTGSTTGKPEAERPVK